MSLGLSALGTRSLGLGPAPASGGSYTLTAAPGAFALDGSAAGLRTSRVLSAQSAGYALTSSGASLRTARVLGVVSGAYSLSGNTVELRADRRLSFAAGAFALESNGAALTYTPASAGHALVVQPGAFLVVGVVAALRSARRLGAETGSCAVLVADGNIGIHRRAVVAGGIVLVDGGATSIRATRVLTCGPGGYALSGYPIAFGELTGALPDTRIYREIAERRTMRARAEIRIALMVPENRIWPGTLK